MSREKPKTPTTTGIARRVKEEKRAKAEKLKQERSNRSDKEQLKILDQRLGKNIGALKERKRLQENISGKDISNRKKKSRS